MKSIAEMKAAIALVQPEIKSDEPTTSTPVRAMAVNVLGSVVPATKHGLKISAKSTSDFMSDVAAVHRYKTLVYEGKIDPSATTEKKSVRTRAR